VAGDTAELFGLLRRSLEACRSSGAEIVDAGVGAGRGTRHLYSSTGIQVSYAETSLSFWLSADDLYSRGFSKRRVIREDEAAEMIEDVAATTAALRSDGSLASGELPVVLPPDEAGSFLGQYVGSNLSGAAVVNGQAAYTLDDFRSGKQMCRDDVSMWVDTLLPLEGAACSVSSEGVPGGRADLIRNGRLVSPVLDLKYAGRAAMPPTPMPRGGPGFLVASDLARPSAADLLAGVERGLYVYSVLGMHTQDSTSGSYSLVASQARAIVDGCLRDGKIKAVLAGNFFENLMDQRTLFAPFPHEWVPGMRIHCSVSVEA
jgi:PmbA protein